MSGSPINIAFSAFAHEFMDVRVHQAIQAFRISGAHVGYYQKTVGAWKCSSDNGPKIAIVQRVLPKRESWKKTVQTLIGNDWLVVLDYDDFPKTPLMVEQGKWQQSLGWDTFKYCHAIQTTTDTLAQLFGEYNSEVGVFPNQIFKMPLHASPNAGAPRIFFGAFNREQSWRPLIESINGVLSRYSDTKATVVHDRAFFDALECKQKKFLPLLGYEEYMAELSKADIALLPLSDEKFNTYKSDIKFLEAAACKAAVIASPTVYARTVVDGENGMIATSPEEWSAKLELLVQNAGQRNFLAENAYNYVVSERLLIQHVQGQLDWYRSLWERREELNEFLLSRIEAC